MYYSALFVYFGNFISMSMECPNLCSMCDISEQCIECTTGRWGTIINCVHPCPATCDGACHDHDGSCSKCKLGFCGKFCQLSCEPNCDGEECQLISGECVCQTKSHTTGAEWTTGKTNERCPLGNYGPFCDKKCSVGCVNGNCRMTDGGCVHGCVNGYQATEIGCIPALSGNDSEESESLSTAETLAIPVSCSVMACCVVVVIVAIVCYRRSRIQQCDTKNVKGQRTVTQLQSGISTGSCRSAIALPSIPPREPSTRYVRTDGPVPKPADVCTIPCSQRGANDYVADPVNLYEEPVGISHSRRRELADAEAAIMCCARDIPSEPGMQVSNQKVQFITDETVDYIHCVADNDEAIYNEIPF
ncbi:multiple epidermal growth factor-like domains protein 6 [Mya arenaria]|uniref:multiple epidermal growth factor-like domains protein 6 n=1 Tax=Mya arenaria TaxID=6604 RepID=UPI0022E04A86|nr:multiple epidermal growth factor-like domains protein 6 [Mya arenaria]